MSYAALLSATAYSSVMHSKQRRLDEDVSPYINHPLAVADLLATAGGVTDLVTLQAAILHDTIEDTCAVWADLVSRFGVETASVVLEVSDDKTLPKARRKELQIEHAPHLSPKAKLVKLADKISNLRDIVHTPPKSWTLTRRQAYFDWAKQVVAGLRGVHPGLEKMFDEVYAQRPQAD
jgi:guanosine-3',5'-bis(diphosphate) 3'-pyrophosphohydrolase